MNPVPSERSNTKPLQCVAGMQQCFGFQRTFSSVFLCTPVAHCLILINMCLALRFIFLSFCWSVTPNSFLSYCYVRVFGFVHLLWSLPLDVLSCPSVYTWKKEIPHCTVQVNYYTTVPLKHSFLLFSPVIVYGHLFWDNTALLYRSAFVLYLIQVQEWSKLVK